MEKKRIALLMLILVSAYGRAQTPSSGVSTSLSRSSAYVGETVYLTFSLQTEEKPVLSPLRNVYGLDIQYQGENVGTQMTTTIINGQRKSQTVYQYRYTYAVTPEEPGEYVIPRTSIRVGTDEYMTSPVKLTAKPVERNDHFRLRLIPDCGSRAYDGQSVCLTVEMEISSDIDNLEITIPYLTHCEILPSSDNRSDSGHIKINDGYYPAVKEATVRNRAVFSTRICFIAGLSDPGRETDFLFENATASFRAVTAVRESVDMFGRTVKDNQYTSIRIPAEGGRLKILPLPQPQPDDFSGIVGIPHLESQADIREAYIGDPITYQLIVSGPVRVPTEMYPLNQIKEFSSSFKIPERHSPPFTENGKTVFVYTIRPLSDSCNEIPEYKCSVFNPGSGRYESVTAPALPLKVLPSPATGTKIIEEFPLQAPETQKVNLRPVKGTLPPIPSLDHLPDRAKRFPGSALWGILYGILLLIFSLPFWGALIYCRLSARPETLAGRKKKLLRHIRRLQCREETPELIELRNLLLCEYSDVTEVYPQCRRLLCRIDKNLFSGSLSDKSGFERSILNLLREALQ